MATDPVDGQPGTPDEGNPHDYVQNDPLNLRDPLGTSIYPGTKSWLTGWHVLKILSSYRYKTLLRGFSGTNWTYVDIRGGACAQRSYRLCVHRFRWREQLLVFQFHLRNWYPDPRAPRFNQVLREIEFCFQTDLPLPSVCGVHSKFLPSALDLYGGSHIDTAHSRYLAMGREGASGLRAVYSYTTWAYLMGLAGYVKGVSPPPYLA